MATTPTSSSPQETSPLPVNAQLLPVLPAPPQPSSATPSTNPRRLPPPCWSHDETVALIDAYRDKWYTLRRGNLKANHWQEVAEAVARRCPIPSPPKTAVQCRHKMEKLRKRYRTEIQRARSMPVSRFSSSWVHFKRMDAMEKGPSAKPTYNSGSDNENEDDDSDHEDNGNQDYYEDGLFNNSANRVSDNMRSVNKMYRNGAVAGSSSGAAGGGFRLRIPTGVSIAQPAPSKFYAKIDNSYSSIPNPNFNSNNNPNAISGFGARVFREFDDKARNRERERERERGKEKEEKDPIADMVAAVKVLGDGFVRMEQMKMEMAREIETMRMEMEMKRTEMILESQQRLVEAFAKAMSDNKKKSKRMPLPES
ncbi:trihelix transcription factor ASIL2 [Tripterygium wilfordii]|uniref:Trihelix transcription factor ASIL2 n=1 Tax=Tripterygium wilfordii TaxID=458696 RepID=A0A7J7CCY9_TRIWF|nr:trihelix transcription factor ASIL2-like [Tripterygium wilfordii]KAF5731596.1 trihelix transcription factor ASIL2 [Tripterygium wilfordii]